MKVSFSLFILVALTVVMFGFEEANGQTENFDLEARFININGQLRAINTDLQRIDSALQMRWDYAESQTIRKMQDRIQTLEDKTTEERTDLLSISETQSSDATDVDELRQEVVKNNSSTNNVEISDFQKFVALRDDIDSLKEEIAQIKRSRPAPARTRSAPPVQRP